MIKTISLLQQAQSTWDVFWAIRQPFYTFFISWMYREINCVSKIGDTCNLNTNLFTRWIWNRSSYRWQFTGKCMNDRCTRKVYLFGVSETINCTPFGFSYFFADIRMQSHAIASIPSHLEMDCHQSAYENAQAIDDRFLLRGTHCVAKWSHNDCSVISCSACPPTYKLQAVRGAEQHTAAN